MKKCRHNSTNKKSNVNWPVEALQSTQCEPSGCVNNYILRHCWNLVTFVFRYTHFFKDSGTALELHRCKTVFSFCVWSQALTHLKTVTRNKSRGWLSKAILLLHDKVHPHSAADNTHTSPRYNPYYHMLGPLKEVLKEAWTKISQWW